MKPYSPHTDPTTRQAFTLLELMVAIVIMVIAMSIAFQAFSGIIRGWKRGTEVANGIKHGDYVINQLVAALDSTIYFYNPKKTYAFTVEKDNMRGYPADAISFVTASSAFIPANSPYIKGPHRINLFLDTDDRGDPALFILPMPAIANPDDFEDDFEAEPILVSREVRGLEILFWDAENEQWTEEWEAENSVPERIQVTVLIAPPDANEDPMPFTRLIEIPVFANAEARLAGPTTSGTSGGGYAGRRPGFGSGNSASSDGSPGTF